MSSNANLTLARRNKNDEFYTRLVDIEHELRHYVGHFRDKTVFLNCDDPAHSGFWEYFDINFDVLGLHRVISTHYTGPGSGNLPPSYMQEIVRRADGTRSQTLRTDLSGDGDFRSEEALALLAESDIVVTNPPFSLFREYIGQLMDHGKKFLVLGNTNAVTYKEIWPHIQDGRMWLGASTFNTGMYFYVPEDFEYAASYKFDRVKDGKPVCRVSNICWYTNLDHSRRHEEITLFRSYDENTYPVYDGYDAIEVSRVSDIPLDFDGIMGVPITFLGKHSPEQFDIVGCSYVHGRPGTWPEGTVMSPQVDGRNIYKRLFIRHSR